MSESRGFPNLAGLPDIDDVVAAELEAAGIEVHRFRLNKNGRSEVDTEVIGELHGWSFRRSWRYWVAEGPGIEAAAAERLHATHGQEVRVDGHCGCPSPLEQYRGLAVGFYHVDTPRGLRALADTLRELVDRARAGGPPPLDDGATCLGMLALCGEDECRDVEGYSDKLRALIDGLNTQRLRAEAAEARARVLEEARKDLSLQEIFATLIKMASLSGSNYISYSASATIEAQWSGIWNLILLGPGQDLVEPAAFLAAQRLKAEERGAARMREAAAALAEGIPYRERYRTWAWWPADPDGSRGNRGENDFLVQHCDDIAANIRLLPLVVEEGES